MVPPGTPSWLIVIAIKLLTFTPEGKQTPCTAVQDQEQRTRDLIDTARAPFSTHQPHLEVTKLTNWQETTATIAAGLSPQPVERLDDEDDETVVDHP